VRPNASSSVPSTPASQVHSRCPQTRPQCAFKHTVAFHPFPSLQGRFFTHALSCPSRIFFSFSHSLTTYLKPRCPQADASTPSSQVRPQHTFKRILNALKRGPNVPSSAPSMPSNARHPPTLLRQPPSLKHQVRHIVAAPCACQG
jgi:hypothetical protein